MCRYCWIVIWLTSLIRLNLVRLYPLSLGRLPENGSSLEADGCIFEVVTMDGHKIEKVHVIPKSDLHKELLLKQTLIWFEQVKNSSHVRAIFYGKIMIMLSVRVDRANISSAVSHYTWDKAVRRVLLNLCAHVIVLLPNSKSITLCKPQRWAATGSRCCSNCRVESKQPMGEVRRRAGQ